MIEAGTPVADLILPESVVTLPLHPDADRPAPAGSATDPKSGVLAPYRAAEIIAAPFVADLRRKRA